MLGEIIMKLPQWFKRFLCLLIVLSMLPVAAPHAHAAAANGIVDAAVIFSDLHTNKSDYKESTVKGVMSAVKNAGLNISSVTSAGDAFSVNEDSSSSNGPYTGKTGTITGYIQNVFGNVPVNYVWSDHDRYAVQADGSTLLDKKSKLIYGAGNDGIYGTADDGNYYIYSLSMGDLCSYDRYKAGFNYTATNNSGRVAAGFTPTVAQAIANFQADAAKLNKDRPLLIVSHQPLFDNRNDNAWAENWFDAINAVATEMDVAFFYGHNHKYDSGSDYYYAKGSTMPVATADNWNYNYEIGVGYKPSIDLRSRNKTLNFTHMCAGYLEPTSTGSYSNTTTRKGTVVSVTIYEDSIRYVTYNSNGVYTGNFALNVSVPRDHAVTEPELVVSGTDTYFAGQDLDITVSYKEGSRITDVTSEAHISGYDMNTAADQTVSVSYSGLTAEFPIRVRHQHFTDAATGITATVEVPGATALTVKSLSSGDTAFEEAANLLSKAAGYQISFTGLTEGNATVTLPIPAGVTTPAVYRLSNGNFTRIDAAKSGSSVSFTASSFGTILIGQEELTEAPDNSIIGNGSAYEEKTVYVRVNSFENGGKYLIVGEDKPTNGNLIAYLNNSGSEGWETVTINTGSINGTSTEYIEINNANAVWTATGSATGGFTLRNNNRYIGGTDANTLKSREAEAVKVVYDASAARLKTASGTTRYLYYSTYGSENWKWSTSANSSTSSRNMWIYKEMSAKVSASVPVSYTIEASNLNHILSTDTAQLQFSLLADGTAAELPNGASYSFEVRNDDMSIIAAISDQGLITFSGNEGSCYVKISCSWSEGTVYKYVKVTAEADPNACDHVYTEVITDATCTEDGSIVYTCSCGDSYTEVIPATGHSHEVTVSDATCTQDGQTTYVCACGDSYIEVIPATGHTYNAIVTAPTCTEDGFTTYTCACGDTYTGDEVAALGHRYESTMTEATCTEDGFITYTCFCGHSSTEVIPAIGHKYEAVVTAPTCTEDGFTTYTCSCGDTYAADKTTALGHTYETTTVDATCGNEGSVTYLCHCGDTYTEVVPALGHTYTASVTNPTCTKNGFTTYTCSCGKSYTANEVAPLGHDYKAITVDATCGTDGSVTYTCHCGDSYSEVIPATGKHNYEAVITAPTCTEDGFTTYTCSCGDAYVGDEVAALGHDYESITVDATCGAAGSVTYTCHCGDSYSEVIPATGKHNYEAVITAPTCTEDGFTTYTCHCGDTYVGDEVAALGHDYETITVDATCTDNGSVTKTCQRCGATATEVIPAPGHNYETITTNATCTENGSVVKTCKHCDETSTEVIPALGHDHKASITAPTCTEGGYTTYTCSCGNTYVADEVAALGHNYVTTEQNGTLIRTCGNCGHSEVISEPLENSVTTGSSSYEEKTVYVRTNAFENNGKYLLIGEDKATNGNPIAYLNNSGSEGWEIVTINSDNIELTNPNAVWTATGSATGGFTLRNNNRYIGGTNANTLKSREAEAVKVVYDASAARLKTASGTTRYFYYSTYGSENWKWSTSANSSTSSRKMLIFKEETVQIPTSTIVTYSMQAPDLHHLLNSNTAQLQFALLANGTATELPAGGSYRFEVKDDSQGIISDISSQGIVTFSGTEGSCYVKVSYSWSEGTVYKYVKVSVETVCAHSYEATTTAPTCTEDGSTVYTCTCGDTYSEVIPATGHAYSSTESDGSMVYTCDNCGHSYSEKISSTYTKVSSISAGKRYVITLVSGGKYYALSHAANKISVVGITVSGDKITSEITDDLLWGYADKKLSYEANNSTYYLYASGNSLTISTSKSSSVSFSQNQLKIGTNYLRYATNKVSLNRRATTTNLFIEE